MAASIRIRISKVEFDSNALNHSVDPFWLLISDTRYPIISDVIKRVVSICDDNFQVPTINCKANDTHESESEIENANCNSNSRDAGKDSSPTCELWLDGCRLLDSEQTAVLRENDSVTVKFTRNSNLSKGARVWLRRNENNADDGDIPSKGRSRKRTKNPTFETSPSNCYESEDQKSKKRIKLSGERIVCGVKEEDGAGESGHNEKKKKKKDKEHNKDEKKEKTKDSSDDSSRHLSKSNLIDAHLSANNENVGPSYEKNDFEMKESGKKSKPELDDDRFSPVLEIPEVKKRRRRRKTKRKDFSSETPKQVKVEDKPRSSILNLPWDQQPQNTKSVFESDSSAEEEEVKGDDKQETKQTSNENKNKDSAEIIPQDLQITSSNISDNVNDSIDGCIKSEAVVKKPQKQPILSSKAKRFIMKSTLSVLDSLRSNSPSGSSGGKQPAKMLSSPSHSNEKSLPSDAKSKSQFVVYNKPVVKSEATCSLLKRDNYKTPKQSVNLNGSNSVCGNSTSMMNVGKSSFGPGRNSSPGRMSLPTTAPNTVQVGNYVDPDAKFSELLGRRKLGSVSCTVSTTENGITVCSRNKSPRWKDAFANPANDVLTNKSTIVKSKMLTNGDSSVSPAKAVVNGSAFAVNTECDKVEVIPLDVEKCSSLSGNPQNGDVIGYKILEMTDDYTPAVSNFKIGKVLSCEAGSVLLEVFGTSASKKKRGKFDLVYDDDEGKEETTSDSKEDSQVWVDLGSMMDIRLVDRDNPR